MAGALATALLLSAASLFSATSAHSHEQAGRMDFVPPAAGTYRLQRIMTTPEGVVLDSDGSQHKLSSFTTGKVTLFSFIYTYCTDPKGCPLAYATLHQLKQSIEANPKMRDQVRFVSMSFDPQYDTPQAMRSYGGKDARDTQGLPWHFLTTRSRQDLRPLLDGFGQDVSLAANQPAGQRVPLLSHMLKVFLIDASGQVREIYSTSFLLHSVLLNDVKTLLMEQGVKFK
ncbi:SCO family protein [Paraherbaspirillum soli]|uniref:SCO family protein n=1 Tax=Paraherbaspirillum soli TaxID=631222 RepID=A0ABW0M3P5_9BURK